MSKKNQGNLHKLQDAVARIKRVMQDDSGDNEKFSQALDIAEKKLLDELYAELSQSLKPGKKAIAKPGLPENKDLSVRQN